MSVFCAPFDLLLVGNLFCLKFNDCHSNNKKDVQIIISVANNAFSKNCDLDKIQNWNHKLPHSIQ